jgi:hypothetical protein
VSRVKVRWEANSHVPTVIADSVTDLGPDANGAVAIVGSHGGVIAAQFGAAAGVRAMVLNDAGVGKDRAGILGVLAADDWGIAAAAVDASSARIGDGEDTYASGVISTVNLAAVAVGVQIGMPARAAAVLLGRWARSGSTPAISRPAGVIHLCEGDPSILGVDSASQINESFAGSIVVTGSHGGLVSGQPIRHPVRAAFFNDAGIGKEEAGIKRLPALASLGIPGIAISHWSARIGDALDAYQNGVISRVNEPASTARIRPGMSVRRACALLVISQKEHLNSRGAASCR